jgi:sulfite reductase alpha subunit-like flavoprotein
MEMDKFSPCILPNQPLVVFVCSTTGQGEEPDNMKTFWKFLLRRNLPTDSLINVQIAVLGLGDSSYLKYNYVAKRLYRRLLQLGAKPILDLGLADDQHSFGAEAMIAPWITSLWSKLEFLYPLPHDLQPGNINEISSPRYKVKIIHVTNAEHILSEVKNPPTFPKLVANNRTTDETHFQVWQ